MQLKEGKKPLPGVGQKFQKKVKKHQKQQISKLVKKKLLIFLPASILSIDMALVHCNTYFCLYFQLLM
jgi:hypothetical protein